MLQSRVRQPQHSRCQDSAPQTHLRELAAQSSHGRPARSPTNIESRQLPSPPSPVKFPSHHSQPMATKSKPVNHRTKGLPRCKEVV